MSRCRADHACGPAARAGAPTAALAGRGVVCRDLRAIRTRPARQSLSCPSRFAMTVAGNQVDTARRTNLGGVLRRADGWGALIRAPRSCVTMGSVPAAPRSWIPRPPRLTTVRDVRRNVSGRHGDRHQTFRRPRSTGLKATTVGSSSDHDVREQDVDDRSGSARSVTTAGKPDPSQGRAALQHPAGPAPSQLPRGHELCHRWRSPRWPCIRTEMARSGRGCPRRCP